MLVKYKVQLSTWIEVEVDSEADKWDIEAEAIKVFKKENKIPEDSSLDLERLDHYED